MSVRRHLTVLMLCIALICTLAGSQQFDRALASQLSADGDAQRSQIYADQEPYLNPASLNPAQSQNTCANCPRAPQEWLNPAKPHGAQKMIGESLSCFELAQWPARALVFQDAGESWSGDNLSPLLDIVRQADLPSELLADGQLV